MLLVTGGTGFVGSHFLYRALERKLELLALARGADAAAARGRLEKAVHDAAASYYEAVDSSLFAGLVGVAAGDITAPRCGVDDDWLARWRGRVSEVWHIAASVEFEERKAASIRQQNVDGTDNALELARALGASRFIYVSTAYTAGKICGDVPSTRHPGPRQFNNCYEQSKWEAEELVARRAPALGLSYAIVRPSIVVGPSTTKRTGGTETGIYGFLRELRRIKRLLSESGEQIAIKGDPDSELNLIPVDKVVDEMLALRAEGIGESGAVHHLTATGGPKVGPAIAVACEVAGVPVIRLIPDYVPESPLETLMGKRVAFYSSYLQEPKRFVRVHPWRSEVSLADLRRFLSESMREHQRDTAETALERSTVTAVDGSALAAYEGGQARRGTVVFVNAYGMPADFALPLARQLPDYRFLTWECRGVPNLSGHLSRESSGLDVQVSDLSALLDARGVTGPVHLVGWCSGTAVVHRFARRYAERVCSVALLNGSFPLPGSATTQFQDNVRQVMPKIAADPAMATFFFRLLFERKGQGEGTAQVHHLLDGIHPSVLHLTSLPFQSARSLYRYALRG
ncbi:MAG: SDR family oxidoreductase [Polyangiales bacterium]